MLNHEEQAVALALAKDLLDDIELDKQILKATRMARLINDPEVLSWLRRETSGYHVDDLDYPYFIDTGRTSSVENDQNFAPGTQIASAVKTLSAELNVLRTPDVSGDKALLAMRAAMSRIGSMRNTVNKYNRILSRVSGLLYEFVSKTYTLSASAPNKNPSLNKPRVRLTRSCGSWTLPAFRKSMQLTRTCSRTTLRRFQRP